jgi:hypothetical protein
MRRLRTLDLSPSMQRPLIIDLVRPWTERSLAMKASMVTAVGLMLVTFAFWIGQAEAQHRGGGRPAVAHPPKGGGRPSAVKAHPPQPKAKQHPPKAKSQQKPAEAKAKATEKKNNGGMVKQDAKKDRALEKEKNQREEKKEHREKEERKERREKEERKELREKKEREERVGARGKPLGKAMAPERAKEAVSKTSP